MDKITSSRIFVTSLMKVVAFFVAKVANTDICANAACFITTSKERAK